MERAIFENLKKALESLMFGDDEYVLVRHVVNSGEKIKPHYHPRATEWLIIDQGVFDVKVENEWLSGNLMYQTTVFLFPKGKIHAIEAKTKIEYLVLRDKKDKTIYAKEGGER